MRLSDVVILNHNLARSINLERDNSAIGVIQDYQLTGKAQEVLGRFVDALEGEQIAAWSLVGPYGMGKSAFLNFLRCVTGPVACKLTQAALRKLKAANDRLFERYVKARSRAIDGNAFFRVPIVASFASINSTLAKGVYNAVLCSSIKGKDAVCARLEKLMATDGVESAELLMLIRELSEAAGTPLVIIIDELGKSLEYLSYHYHDGDLFILQELAEMGNVFLWVSLHQAFQEYMPSFSVVQQHEWQKVQGRFEEISFVESMPQMLDFMRRMIEHRDVDGLGFQIGEWARKVGAELKAIDALDNDLFDFDAISSLYPLHPITCLALVELCRRYAQNERTLVSFLCSGHMFALPYKMNSITLDQNLPLPAIGLDTLYDYFFRLSNASFSYAPAAQRWVEIHDIIQRAALLGDSEGVLLRSIGVLNGLGGLLGLRASPGLMAPLMEHVHRWRPEKTQGMVDLLVQRGLMFSREYADEFRLWEGSDFDVAGAINSEKEMLSIGSLEELLEEYLPLSSVVAPRHSLEKGTIRKFERRWIDSETLSSDLHVNDPEYDGLFLYCFGTAKKLDNVPAGCKDEKPLMVVYAPVKEAIAEIATELVACQSILDRCPQVSYDKVARKEVRFRYGMTRERFRTYCGKAFAPNSDGLIWYANGSTGLLYNWRQLSSKLSGLCDEYYKLALTIGNEIVSAERLSSSAIRARRELIEAMATKAHAERLGFVGCGPEVAMYQSLLLAKDLHRLDASTGTWYLTLEGNEPELPSLWAMLRLMMFDADQGGVTVEEMVDRLRQPPFGMKQGASLVYISLYLLVESESLIVFCDNVYRPYLLAADMALLLKRPDLFVVKVFAASEVQRQVFSVYKSVIKHGDVRTDEALRNATMLGVMGPMLKLVDELPRYSKQTKSISKRAQRARAATINAVDPLRFLFVELPKALGVDTADIDDPQRMQLLEERLHCVLAELSNALKGLQTNIERALLEGFEVGSMSVLYASQNPKARCLVRHCESPDLRSVLGAIARKDEDMASWARGIAGAIVQKPVDAWGDEDPEVYRFRLRDYVEQIDQLAAIVGMGGDAHVISVMLPGGHMRRGVIHAEPNDPEVESMLKQAAQLPPRKARAMLASLAASIIVRGNNDE